MYVFVYAVAFMMHDLNMTLLDDDLIYLVWSLLFTSAYALLAGGISSLSATLFVNYIYSRAK